MRCDKQGRACECRCCVLPAGWKGWRRGRAHAHGRDEHGGAQQEAQEGVGWGAVLKDRALNEVKSPDKQMLTGYRVWD